MSAVLDAALSWRAAGCSVIPVKIDYTKAPALAEWTTYQHEIASEDQIREWFTADRALGVVCGEISGNLEMIEFEGRALAEGVFTAFHAAMVTEGHEELFTRITSGYVESSPSGGLHLFAIVSASERVVGPNVKLAQREARDDELTDRERDILQRTGKRALRVLIETRGEGGQVVVAPSPGHAHESGRPWAVMRGTPADIPTITAAELDILHAVAFGLDRTPITPPVPEHFSRDGLGDGDRHPGEDYNERADWREILEPLGWTIVRASGERLYWRRPGKRYGLSAVTGGGGENFLYVWSTSTELPAQTAMSPWRVYAKLWHGEDYSAAARELRYRGYGSPLPELPADVPGFSFTPGTLVQATPQQPAVDQELIMDAGDPTAELVERRIDALAEFELLKLKARDRARRLYKQEGLTQGFGFSSVRLDSLLEEPDESQQYIIEGLWPEGARVLLAAQYKAGKTTMTGNLIRCLVDEDEFLGAYNVTRKLRVGLVDTEMTRDMIKRWMRDQGIVNRAAVEVFPMRGQVSTLDIMDDRGRADMAQILQPAHLDVLILDCLRPVLDALGLAEDKDAGKFLVYFDELLKRADIGNGMVVHHMGHQQERSRGDSRIRDWPDVEWKLVRDTEDPASTRFFSAFGRDVQVEESEIFFNSINRHLSIVGGSRQQKSESELLDAIKEVLRDYPSGLSKNALAKAVYEHPDFNAGGLNRIKEGITRYITAGKLESQAVSGSKTSAKIVKLPSRQVGWQADDD